MKWASREFKYLDGSPEKYSIADDYVWAFQARRTPAGRVRRSGYEPVDSTPVGCLQAMASTTRRDLRSRRFSPPIIKLH
jgi:hypothetical protein